MEIEIKVTDSGATFKMKGSVSTEELGVHMSKFVTDSPQFRMAAMIGLLGYYGVAAEHKELRNWFECGNPECTTCKESEKMVLGTLSDAAQAFLKAVKKKKK